MSGLDMYYEVHGAGESLVLLHGAMSTIETSFGAAVALLAESRRVIAVEQQGHGRTLDVDRPLTYRQMAADTAGLLHRLEIGRADFFGFSMGSGIAVELAIRHPMLVRRLVVASLAYDKEGFHPGLSEAIDNVGWEDLEGSVFHEAYVRSAPRPENWPTLVAKCNELDRGFEGWSPKAIQSIAAPTLVIVGDSDIVRPEHAVHTFRLLGGGVEGDGAGLPASQLAVLPATTHLTLVDRAEWLASMVSAFLEAPVADPSSAVRS
jgi:pimeloyl-ACP methyl ester carboxylesterase